MLGDQKNKQQNQHKNVSKPLSQTVFYSEILAP